MDQSCLRYGPFNSTQLSLRPVAKTRARNRTIAVSVKFEVGNLVSPEFSALLNPVACVRFLIGNTLTSALPKLAPTMPKTRKERAELKSTSTSHSKVARSPSGRTGQKRGHSVKY